MCPIAFRSARGNSRVDCFGFGGCLSLPLPRSGEGVWSLWFDAHAGGLADVSLTQVPQPPRSPPAWLCLQICGSVWLGAFAPHLLESKRCTRAHRHNKTEQKLAPPNPSRPTKSSLSARLRRSRAVLIIHGPRRLAYYPWTAAIRTVSTSARK